ncbi:hypothetical protein BAAM0483_05035 [Bifidobacterium animalis subsp. animalis MCC 0483]|uniref:DUF4313 domain-containing protein n=1 Tax=Bifidobacterium animalis subsp. animalis MCC 0483 TaxID=1365955 RepID=A0AB34T8J0_9BIFI|nr:hypothetical protein [Bifidobacterium animalis]KOA49512.1 hypothetical protein BAAM0483_05035 [Bifidobacterium animalis subsp. animalis MCC 0483]
MKTVKYEWMKQDGQPVTALITVCETIEDILSLDASIDEQRLKRALAARPINNVSEWTGQWAADDPKALQPDEVVFLTMSFDGDNEVRDWNGNWYYVKGSGICFAPEICSFQFLIPFLLEPDRNGKYYTNYYISDYGENLWSMNSLGFMPSDDIGYGYKDDDPISPEDMGEGLRIEHVYDATRFPLCKYQSLLRNFAPFHPVDVRYRPLGDTTAEWVDATRNQAMAGD